MKLTGNIGNMVRNRSTFRSTISIMFGLHGKPG